MTEQQAPARQGQAPTKWGQAPTTQGQAPTEWGQAPARRGQAPTEWEQARKEVIEHLLKSTTNPYKWRVIESLLEKARGNVTKALQLTGGKTYRLRYSGYCARNHVSYKTWGPIKSHNIILVWLPEKSTAKKADFTISWKEVFQYVLENGNAKVAHQPRLM